MNPKQVVQSLESDGGFQRWRTNHPDDILAHIFLETDNIQVGFFDPSRSTMTTFIVGTELHIIPDQEILRGDSAIDPLDLSQIRFSPQQAQEVADALRKTHYTAEQVIKTLSILQTIDGLCVYNITYFTASFKTINIKVSAIDGSVVRHSIGSLVDLEKGNKDNKNSPHTP